jgi:hypothetical protein
VIGIISWLTNIAKALGYWFQEIFREAIKFCTTTWGVVVIAGGLAYTVAQDTVAAFNEALTAIGAIDPSASLGSTSGIGTFLAVTNTFLPLDEVFAYGGAYLVLVCAVGVYRIIKSWIPTLSGSG